MVLRTLIVSFLLLPSALQAQTVGQILGRITDAATGAPLAGVRVELLGSRLQSLSAPDGRYLVVAVPPGEHTVRFEVLGYKPVEMEAVTVRAGRPTQLNVQLSTAPIPLPNVTVQADRVRLVEPEVSTTRDIVVARELKALPIDNLKEAVELTPGVSGGHFRGGRIGQESYVVDGLEIKNQFESSAQGLGLELSPTSLEEVEVVTGGFGAQFGSALSGVVSYVTRRGNREHWNARASLTTDQWAPEPLFFGFTALSMSAGGPLSFLGEGTTLFADVLAQGMLDADPRARGLTCLEPGEATTDLAPAIESLRSTAPDLYCPYTSDMLPHQRGDKLILFTRLDRPIGRDFTLTVSALRNRLQRELYTPEFRFADAQLGQRVVGSLGTIALDWNRQGVTRAFHGSARAALMRIDRHLGAVDPWSFDGRARIAGFGPGDFRFLGEDFVRREITEQLREGGSVPGYEQPGGAGGSPYGGAGTGIFYADGTPHIANWSRTDMASFNLVGEMLSAAGNTVRAGGTLRLFGAESYERTLSYLAGSSPSYARFYPRVLGAFAESHLGDEDGINFDVGVRVDAFKSGIDYQLDRNDFLSDVVDARWRISVNPRFGASLPIRGSNGGAMFRFNYGYVSQPPDFRYFLDSTIGDSARTDIRRQGNPDLSFERGRSYEVSATKLFTERAAVTLTLFRKELTNVVTGSLRLGETGEQQYSTNDRGTVRGAEFSLRGRAGPFGVRGSWAIQKATGLASGLDSDTLVEARQTEYPLAFDRRHSIDFALTYGRAAGALESGWSAALTGSAESGYPLTRLGDDGALSADVAYLPWTHSIDLRLTRELGRLPGCGSCEWRVALDGRNLTGAKNILAYRSDTNTLSPQLHAVQQLADQVPPPDIPIPAESPSYARSMDLNNDGMITGEEFRTARFAAALDRHDPSLFFGEARQLRLGIEVTFR